MHLARAMRDMRGNLESRGWAQGAVVLAALLILGTGFCLFDGDAAPHGQHGHDDDTPRDLCSGMIAASLVIPFLACLRIGGWILPEPCQLVYAPSPHLADPPPKLPARV